ncbi:MAG: HAD family hydrolase [Erysipelotrichaceae bacterium]|nr:HAD family hydrolase [Erysipelotrichaceae bacterium]MDD3809086.1 HAD family hydrolase [Erysipelotrichaceae bacterium]
MKKVIFTDLDETLLINHHVPKENQEAIQKAKDKGVKVIPCTGRAFGMIKEITQEMGIDGVEGEYAICFNGGLIMDLSDDSILHYRPMSFDLIKPIFENGVAQGLCILIFALDKVFIFNPLESEIQRKIAQKADFEVLEVGDFRRLKELELSKILYVNEEKQALDEAIGTLEKNVRDNVAISYSSNRYAEFNPAGVDKGWAIHYLCEKLGISVEDTIGVGDNYNDIKMIEATGLGVYMANAPHELAIKGDYVTEKRYDEGGFVEVVEKFILND